jgi:hypothetical protein
VALVLFIIGLRDRRRADEDRRLAADDRLRDQARKVWMWPVSWEVDRLGPIKNILYKITNDSDDPISDCQVSVKGQRYIFETLFGPSPDMHVLPARQTKEHRLGVDVDPLPEGIFNLSNVWPGPPLQLNFTDAAGVRWLRQSDGLLEPISRPNLRRR